MARPAPRPAAVPAMPPAAPPPLVMRLGHLEFHVIVEVANRRHAAALVNGLLDFRRHGDVFHDEAGNLDAVFARDLPG